MTKEAVIIGGSIGGLMCGVMLKHHGYTVTIFEKEDLVSRQNFDAGISIRDEVLDFLKKHDRVKRDMTITCPPGTTISMDGKSSRQRGQVMTLTSWALMISVLRANFDGMTSKAVPHAPPSMPGDGAATYRSKVCVTGIKDAGERVEVEYEDRDSRTTDTVSADLVVVADGSNSSTRRILLPDVKREYAGYMLWRGTTREDAVDAKWNDMYSAKSTFSFGKGTYLLNYTIPADDGDLTPGNRLHNWVWYANLAADSPALQSLFTDINGTQHFSTLPRGLVNPDLWEAQKSLARTVLQPGHAAIVAHATAPFVTKIFDVAAPKALFMRGKVLLVGDAQVTLRPNVGLGLTHAARDCNELERVVEGGMAGEEWETSVLRDAKVQVRYARAIASYGLGSKLALVRDVGWWLLVVLGQKVGVV